MNKHDQVSGVEATANAPSKGRRRLVKGVMLTTPAVMTLVSGRLMAATSLGACGLPSPVEGDGIAWVDTNGDTLVWGEVAGSRVLGHIQNGEFVQVTLATSQTCLTSLGNPLNPLN